MAGALVAALKARCSQRSLHWFWYKETAPVIAVAVVVSALLTALIALRAARRAARETIHSQTTPKQSNQEVVYE